MLKKFSLIIFCMFLMACSNTMTVTDYSEKDEVVKQVITNSKKDVILLGNNYDYLFTGEEARKLLTLIDFFKMKGLTKENVSRIDKKITVNENGEVRLWVSTDFIISKKNNVDDENYEKEQENFVNNFKIKLEEKNIEYKVMENNLYWRFNLPNAINVYGKVVKLENHNKILEETSSQLINLKINLIMTKEREVQKYTKGDIIGGVATVVLAPIWIPVGAVVAAAYTVVAIPALIISYTINQ